MDVKIVAFPETKVAAIEHRGDPKLENESIQKLINWRIDNRLSPSKHKSYGVHYNNPATTPSEIYRVDLCVSFDQKIAKNAYGVINKVIPAGRCAVARHLGSRNNVIAAAYLYGVWLPSSGETLGDYPLFFHYVNVGPGIQESEMVTDVYLPLA